MKKVISVSRTLSFFSTNVSVTQLAITKLNNKNFRTRREIYSSKQERHHNDSSDNNLVLFLLILDKLFTSF